MTKPAATDARTRDPKAHRHWEVIVSAAFLRCLEERKYTQKEAAEAVGRSARTIRDWESDHELWRAATDEARRRWLPGLADTARRTLARGVARNPDLALRVLERIDPVFAPPKQGIEHSGTVGYNVAVIGPGVPTQLPANGNGHHANGNGNGNGKGKAAVISPANRVAGS